MLPIQFQLPDKPGDLNGSMQYPSRTRRGLKTKGGWPIVLHHRHAGQLFRVPTLAAGEGAGLDAALLRFWDGDVDAVPGKNCLRSRLRVMRCECRWPCRRSRLLRIACATVAHPRLPTAGSRERGTRKFKSKSKPENRSSSASTAAVVLSPWRCVKQCQPKKES